MIMLLQSVISLVTITLVIARAVNVLKSPAPGSGLGTGGCAGAMRCADRNTRYSSATTRRTADRPESNHTDR